MSNKKIVPIILSVFIVLSLSFVVIPAKPTNNVQINVYTPAFDQYGQGFDGFTVQENSTGSWENILQFGGLPDEFNVSYDMFLRFKVSTRLNSSAVGVSSLNEGKLYHRHSVNVTVINGTSVFQQQNFTYFNSADVGGIYYYDYHIILNFRLEVGFVYTCNFLYEIYFVE